MEPASSTSPDAERVPSGSSGSLEHPDTAERVEPVGRPGAVDSIDRLLLVGGTLLLVGLHLYLSWRISGPSVTFDESGYLGNARLLARNEAGWDMPISPFYAIGYPVVLAPLMVLFDSAEAQWRAVLTLNAILLASVFPLLAAVLRRLLNLTVRRAMVASAVGAVAPAVVAAGISAIAENLVLPLVLVMVLAAWTMVDAGAGETPASRLGRYGFGPAVALLYLTHSRFVLVVALALVTLAVGRVIGVIKTSVALTNTALLATVVVVGQLLAHRVREARWDRVREPGGGVSDWIELVTTTDGLEQLYLTATGQAWYLAVGSAGLAVIGFAVLVRAALVRTRAEAGLTPTRSRRLICGFVLAAAGAVFAASVAFFAQNQLRPDHWVYGRHNDSFVPLWIGLGVAALIGAAPLRRRLWDLAIAAAVVAISGIVVTNNRDPATLDSAFSPFAVPAITRHVRPEGTFLRGTVFGVVAVAVLAALVLAASWRASSRPRGRRTLTAVLPVVVAGWLIYAGFAPVRGTERFEAFIYRGWTTPQEIDRLGITELAIESRTSRSRPTLTYPFHLPGVNMTMYEEARDQEPVGSYVLARLDDPARPAAGDRVALLDQGGFYASLDAPVGLAVWVRPGPEQDRLAEAGLLLPEGFPTELPDEAQQAELAVLDRPDEPVEVRSGEQVALQVTGRHAGTGSPWPDQDSFSLDGRVRIMTRITPDDPDNPPGAVSGGELPGWVRPGESFATGVEVFAVDPFLQPLPPGSYEVELGLGQQGGDWFAPGGDDATFTMVVTP
ncbi:hypothetical protein BH23ACT2_BH23ACT2_16040 [soil metagenome]